MPSVLQTKLGGGANDERVQSFGRFRGHTIGGLESSSPRRSNSMSHAEMDGAGEEAHAHVLMRLQPDVSTSPRAAGRVRAQMVEDVEMEPWAASPRPSSVVLQEARETLANTKQQQQEQMLRQAHEDKATRANLAIEARQARRGATWQRWARGSMERGDSLLGSKKALGVDSTANFNFDRSDSTGLQSSTRCTKKDEAVCWRSDWSGVGQARRGQRSTRRAAMQTDVQSRQRGMASHVAAARFYVPLESVSRPSSAKTPVVSSEHAKQGRSQLWWCLGSSASAGPSPEQALREGARRQVERARCNLGTFPCRPPANRNSRSKESEQQALLLQLHRPRRKIPHASARRHFEKCGFGGSPAAVCEMHASRCL
ncbi:hypothetical protein L1887_43986 [Cichorium endivia]|nr:hypothetical protein L1887_43986 [Cichorium endivia]